MLRFRTDQPTIKSRKFLPYRLIAKTLNMTQYEVEHICRKGLLPAKTTTFEKRVRLLDQIHIDYLLCPKTLEEWSGLTLKERTVRFHRRFTDKRIAITSLRRLYLKNGIKRKKVRQEKPSPHANRPQYKAEY